MEKRSAFFTGLWAGLAAPVALFAGPSDYRAAMGGYDLAANFHAVSVGLSRAWGHLSDGDRGRAPRNPA